MRCIVLAAALAAAMGLTTAAQTADITVISSTAMREALEAIAPLFETASGHKVRFEFQSGVDTNNPITKGDVADLVVTTGESVDALITAGKVVPGSRADVFRSRVGVAARAGAPKPDISSAGEFKSAMLAAKTIGYSKDPSGEHLAKILDRLGIADTLTAKGRQPPLGQRVADLVARGEADIGIQQINELLPMGGIDFVGPLPDELQTVLVYSTGIPATAKQREAAQTPVRFVKSDASLPLIKKLGIDPG